MKIKKINIFSFGKFNKKNISLNDGINLILGNNESGKTTLTAFIEGIFYGFSKNSLKRRLYFDEYEKYRPWNSDNYRGSLEIEYEQEDYRIERDFKDDKVSILNLSKHKDLSDDPRNFTYSRVAQPGVIFFDMSSDVFKSSFLIRQLKTRINQDHTQYLKDKIENFVLANDKDLDGKKAIEILNLQADNLGKISRSKSEIGSLSEKIDSIDKKLLELESIDKQVAESRFKLKEINIEIKNAETDLDFYKKLSEQEDFNKIKEINSELDNIKNKLKEMKIIDPDNFQRAIELEKNYLSLESQYEEIARSVDKKTSDDDLDLLDEINKDKENIRKINSRLNDLNAINYSKESEILYSELRQVKDRTYLYIFAIAVSLLFIGVSLYFAINNNLYYLIIGIPFLVLYILLRIRKIRVQKDLFKRLNDRISDYRKKSFDKTKEKRKIDDLLEVLYKKYGADNFIDLQDKIEILSDEKSKEAYIREIETENLEKSSLKLEQIKNAMENIKMELENIYKTNSVRDFEEIRSKFKENENYSDYIAKIKILENQANTILKDRDIKDLDHKLNLEEYNKNDLKKDLGQLKIQRAKLEEELKYKDAKFKDYINLLEEKSKLEKNLKKKLKDKKAIKEAAEIISNLLQENSQDIFPKIIEKMNYFVENITDNKYKKLSIDEDFDIKVYDSNSNIYVDLDSLSSGSIDQIYLALRLSISELISTEAPLILDDHFLQYDDERMQATLKFLASTERQILIFSATNREKNIMDRENIDYKLIDMENIWFGQLAIYILIL